MISFSEILANINELNGIIYVGWEARLALDMGIYIFLY